MKLDKLVGERFKERPANCSADSHAFMVRGGYIKYVASGIYTLSLPMRRIARKIEQIIREEMDAIDGQEVLFPVVLPASLWMESGRYYEVENELVRLNDRHKTPYVLGMTHEEPAVHLVREYGQTYAKYPFMIYQIQTKFRDEMRPKGGLLRVREFTMKDAYSFHTSQEDLEQYYERCYQAYKNVFYRAGLPNVISVASDSGMMGGDISHEFMELSPIGEDSLALCGNCDYRSNLEAAENVVEVIRDDVSEEMVLEHTPDTKTIDAVSEYLGIDGNRCFKAVVYQKTVDDSYVVVFLRGDLDISEPKLKRLLGSDIYPALITLESGICAGYIGPQGLSSDIRVLFDNSVKGNNNMVCGANKDRYHYTGFDTLRDLPDDAEYADLSKIADGGKCPKCGQEAISVAQGIEVGNIFQLGIKYSKAMNMSYTDQEGNEHFPIMGCYGIGVGRLGATVCEAHNDEYGPIWPMSIAPWQVHICAIRSDNAQVAQTSEKLYNDLLKAGVEVICDDRLESAGIMFADADLLGVPIRVVISPKTVEKNVLEISTRDKSFAEDIPADCAVEYLKSMIERMLRSYDVK